MSKFTRVLLTSISFSAAFPAIVSADDAPIVPPVVVSATRMPTPLDQVASSMTVITSDDIARENKPTVIDLLAEAPGVTVAQNGGMGQTALSSCAAPTPTMCW